MFKTKKAFAKEIVLGRKFKDTETNTTIYFDEKYENPFRQSNDGAIYKQHALAFYNCMTLKEVTFWYHEIPPDGVLCWVNCQCANTYTMLSVITDYDNISKSFSNGTKTFKEAIPIKSINELEKYIL